jgi:hypothetical protein
MSNMKNIKDEALENVVGGVKRIVKNSSASYANVRAEAGLNGKVMFKAPNGADVYTTGKTIKKDGYVWYEIACNEHPNGWIAGSLIGY